MSTGSVCFAIAALSLLAPGAIAQKTIPNATVFTVRLLGPISTQTNKKGDQIIAQALAPAEFQGAIFEGAVKRAKNGRKIKGKSVLNFSFDRMDWNNRQIKVSSSVESLVNSHGWENADEEGQVIEKKNNIGKPAMATGFGAIMGPAAGGAEGAAIGAGAEAALIFIEVSTKGPSISFAAGSRFIMNVKER